MNIQTFNKTRLLKRVLRTYFLDLTTVIHKHQQNSDNQKSLDTYLKAVDKSIEKCVCEIQAMYQKQSQLNRNIHKRYSVNKNVSKMSFSEEE